MSKSVEEKYQDGMIAAGLAVRYEDGKFLVLGIPSPLDVWKAAQSALSIQQEADAKDGYVLIPIKGILADTDAGGKVWSDLHTIVMDYKLTNPPELYGKLERLINDATKAYQAALVEKFITTAMATNG